MTNRGDIDIDFPNRALALIGVEHTPASIFRDGEITKHNTGVYFHAMPTDPFTGLASIDYKAAEQKNCYKIDLLNLHVYELVHDEAHLLDLMARPFDWTTLLAADFTKQLFHISNHGELIAILKPSSIIELAMFLALIRPGKKHLIDRCKHSGFNSILAEIWAPSADGYYLKKSHGVSYAQVVVIHAQLLLERVDKQI